MRRENVAAFASGMTGCGKSQLLLDWFITGHPRVVSYDPNGEILDRNPRAIFVRTAEEFRVHLHRATRRGLYAWHFGLCGSPEEFVKVLDLLAPDEAMPGTPTLCRALGGVLAECGEADIPGRNNNSPLTVRYQTKFQRGRHHLLSHAAATQAPALVSRVLTANCHHIFAFNHAERTSLNYWSETIAERAAEEISRLPQYAFVHYERGRPDFEVWASDLCKNKIVRRKIATYPRGAMRTAFPTAI